MEQIRILALSDLHGRFPDVNLLEKADLCLVAGDITDKGKRNLAEVFEAKEWMRKLKSKYKKLYWVPGNHDIDITEHDFSGICVKNKKLTIKFPEKKREIVLWGNSMSLCYNAPIMKNYWQHITDEYEVEQNAFNGGLEGRVDIFLTHCPPYGILDSCGIWFNDLTEKWEECHIGSSVLLENIEMCCPDLLICGHVHQAGVCKFGYTTVYNVAELKEGRIIYY